MAGAQKKSPCPGAYPSEVLEAAAAVLEACRGRGWMLGSAESCTGGLLAGALTSLSGSSDAVAGGLVTYSNEAKSRLLGVPAGLLEEHGAVSAPVAQAMAWGTLERVGSDIVVALTGIAGPTGGSKDKPVGLVHFAVGWRHGDRIQVLDEAREYGDIGRDAVRMAAVATALELLLEVCGEDRP